MAVDLRLLCGDLAEETAVLAGLLAPLDETAWTLPTPAPGWSVKDQLTHLAYFDEATIQAANDPAAFIAGRADALVDVDRFTDQIAVRYRGMTGHQVGVWFQQARRSFIAAFEVMDPRLRLPWYGPDMSAASAVTARIMETWAHGQDVADALGVDRPATAGLRQVAHIGVQTMANSFRAQGRPAPSSPLRVELRGPAGERWDWGPPEAADRVSGPALDFCLVVTQRRHLADTSLGVQGDVAGQWMSIAQAFAGPPGPGRQPGQFSSPSGHHDA